jgi:predicted N-acyltransferase
MGCLPAFFIPSLSDKHLLTFSKTIFLNSGSSCHRKYISLAEEMNVDKSMMFIRLPVLNSACFNFIWTDSGMVDHLKSKFLKLHSKQKEKNYQKEKKKAKKREQTHAKIRFVIEKGSKLEHSMTIPR